MTFEQISQIEATLNYVFVNKDLLIRAFTHSSFVNAKRNGKTLLDSNERTAFFGDSILGMVVSQYLYEAFPNCSKGEMSYIRSNLVSAMTLAPIIERLGLLKYLQLVTDSKPSEHLCGDLFEAIVCAIYLDGGYIPVQSFIMNALSSAFEAIGGASHKDSKTLLQEYCQSKKPKLEIQYVMSDASGTTDKPIYKCDLLINGSCMCSGEGSSKKKAEQEAAKKLVTEWRLDSALS